MRIVACLAVVIAFGSVLGIFLGDRPRSDLSLDTGPPLEVKILPPTGRVINCVSSLEIRIKNRSHRPVNILRPLDGSEDCWLMPFYRLTVLDDRGNTVPRNTGRCKI